MTPRRSRVLLAGLFHETHTFLEGFTTLADCDILQGKELLQKQGDASPLGGFWEAAERHQWEVIPALDLRATPGPLVEQAVVELWWNEFRPVAEAALREGLDAIFLVLHGAMVSAECDDVEGELLERIRHLPGAQQILIGGVLDLHANFTERMARHSNCLVAYRENPHTDARATAIRAVELLEQAVRTGSKPRTFWRHPPLVWPPTGTATAQEPMRSLEQLARQIEAENKNVLAVNVLAGFAFADIPETGVSFSIITTGEPAQAQTCLDRLEDLAWKQRHAGNTVEEPLERVLECLLPLPPGLTLLVEPSDNIGGGAPGDGTSLLRALVRLNISNSAIALNDPLAVEQLRSVAQGQQRRLSIGGKGSRLAEGPLDLEVELVSRHHGKFELEDSASHLASMSGRWFDMGPSAVVRHGAVTILLTSRKTPPFDLAQWRSVGIDPAQLSLLVVKAAVAHRRAYDPITQRSFTVATPGPCTSDLKRLPYRKISRPIFPLDELDELPLRVVSPRLT